MALTARMDFLLDDPRRVLTRPAPESLPEIGVSLLLVITALASLAIADAWMVPAIAPSLPRMIVLYAVDLFAWTFLLSRVSRMWPVPRVRWQAWFLAGTIALAPLYILLPAAFLLQPFRSAGFLGYEFVKLAVFAAVVRRWVWTVETFNAWPIWAAALLVLSPFVILVSLLVAGAVLGAGVVAVALLGAVK